MDRQERSTILREIGTGRKEICNTTEGLLNTLVKNFKLQYNETIKLLQFQKLVRQGNGNNEEWTGRL